MDQRTHMNDVLDLNDPVLHEKYKDEIALIEAERVRMNKQLTDASRLTAEDFAVYINCRG